MKDLEAYFNKVREQIIGIDKHITTPRGEQKKIVYADWTASGRNYEPIERRLKEEIMPYVANTHTETNSTGMAMTYAYHKAKHHIKQHINAADTDVLIACNSGMTGVINKFQRILGLRVHESIKDSLTFEELERPVVFVTHMEHHSNQTSWLETVAEVVIIKPNDENLVCLDSLRSLLNEYKDRDMLIAAVTSCSNVTGIFTPYHEIARLMHRAGGYCFVDFACSAPYIDINMHPEDEETYLDAIYFSPHKFLGGPGTPGVLCFNSALYKNEVPDNPGGGTVEFTNPWGTHKYIDDIEVREDGGTPGFLQTIKASLCMKLKEEMGVENILKREHEIMQIIWNGLDGIENLHILANEHKDRLGIVSFYIDGLHYNAGVKMLNDRFGIQTRGGCSCAGTYGHYLLNIDHKNSEEILESVVHGDCSIRPGWIRMSIHPTTTNSEAEFLVRAIQDLCMNHETWMDDYEMNWTTGEVKFKEHEKDVFVKEAMDQCMDRPLI